MPKETIIRSKDKVISHTIAGRVAKRKTVRRKAKIHLSGDNQYYYVLIGDNGATLNTSETMKRKRSCVDVIEKYFPDFRLVDKTF